MTERTDSVEMFVTAVGQDPTTALHAVVLEDANGEWSLPICIGVLEAASIVISMEDVNTDRPLTHELLQKVMRELGATVDFVELSELRDETCHALLRVRAGNKQVAMDCRPSDAIALALKNDTPIYVRNAVLKARGEISEPVTHKKPTKH